MPASKHRARAVFGTGAALLGTLGWVCASLAVPAGDEILPRILGRLEMDRAALQEYSYLESSLLERRDRDGLLRSQDSETHQIFFQDGRRMKRPVASASVPQGEGGDSGRAEEDPDSPLDLRTLASCFQFDLIGEDTLSGSPLLQVDFTAMPGCLEGTGRAVKILSNLRGTMWIEPGHYEVRRVEGRLQRPVVFGFGLFGKVETFEVELERSPVFLARSFDLRSTHARTDFTLLAADHLMSSTTSSPNPPRASDPDPNPRDQS
jgi:hypothetical protein